jgi:Fe-S-cluster containining protein
VSADEAPVQGERKRQDSVEGSLGCAGCGDCCERISIGTTLHDMRASMSGNGGAGTSRPQHWDGEPEGSLPTRPKYGLRKGEGAREAAFILQHWHPTGEVRWVGGVVQQILSCDQFDPVHRRCMAHETRPRVCSDFPFYGGEPRANMREINCSYYLDVKPEDRPEGSRPLIPIEVITRARP